MQIIVPELTQNVYDTFIQLLNVKDVEYANPSWDFGNSRTIYFDLEKSEDICFGGRIRYRFWAEPSDLQEEVDEVEGPGQFARRGGILDLFSPAEEQPVRMEFWGDEIDSMGYFDISSQRRDETVTECRILPAAEALPTLTPGGTETLCRKMEELAERYQKRRGSSAAGKIAATLRQDAEKLHTQLNMPDLDRWLPLLYPAATGFDYIPEDAVVFVDQPTRCGEMAKEYRKQLGDDLRALQKDGLCPFEAESFCFPPDEIWKELERFPLYAGDSFTLGRGNFQPKTLQSIPAKQLPSYAGNAQAAAEDLKIYLKQNYRVVVLAGDERRAKVLQEFLNEHGTKVLIRTEMETLPELGECCIGVGWKFPLPRVKESPAYSGKRSSSFQISSGGKQKLSASKGQSPSF